MTDYPLALCDGVILLFFFSSPCCPADKNPRAVSPSLSLPFALSFFLTETNAAALAALSFFLRPFGSSSTLVVCLSASFIAGENVTESVE